MANNRWILWAAPIVVVGVFGFSWAMEAGMKEQVRQCLERNWQANGQDHLYLEEVVSDTRGGSFANGLTLHYIEYRTRGDNTVKTTTCGWDW
ncbi:hypothetical protein [Yoonia sp. R2-816]|uniref:hypothetical protein n=1 Tax=Yoonia sp. R2-816 TaxID=3342638 RepID=UPI00372A0438